MNSVGILLDASTTTHFVGVVSGANVLAWRQFNPNQEMMAEVDKAMLEAGLEPVNLDYVAVGIGPGSYTGLRVAQAVAQGISLALKIPLVPLQPMAAYNETQPFAVAVDARISGLYLWQEGMETPESCPLNELSNRVPKGCQITTPDASKLAKRLPEWNLTEKAPLPQLLAEQAEQNFASECTTHGTIAPLYLRKTEAEMTVGAKNKAR